MPYTDITALPTAPSRARPSTFAAEGDAFLAALATIVTEVNASGAYIDTKGSEVEDDATAAANSASAAGTSETNAANSATAAANSAASVASAWSSGASYSVGTLVYSTVDYQTYRAITTHSGETTDPSSDTTNWVSMGGGISTGKSIAMSIVFG
jgi:hypothetical protein